MLIFELRDADLRQLLSVGPPRASLSGRNVTSGAA
jgi:hypothetical protein